MSTNLSYKLISTYRTQLMGAAILWVVFFHSTVDISTVPVLSTIKLSGYGGVDLFLMLSGVGMYYSYYQYHHIVEFYKKRLYRIIPTYLPVVFVFCGVSFLYGKMSLTDVFINLTTLSFWCNSDGRFDWFIPSILVFYAVTPIFLSFFQRINRYIITFAVMFAGILLSMLISASSLDYLLICTTRIPVFFIGILMGYWIVAQKELTATHMLIHSLLFLVGLTMLYVSISRFYDMLWSHGLLWYPFIFITPPLCMAIVALFNLIREKGGEQWLWPIAFCGNHSLEIYLFHERILLSTGDISDFFAFDRYKIVINIICFAVSLILAYWWKKTAQRFRDALSQLH